MNGDPFSGMKCLDLKGSCMLTQSAIADTDTG